MFKCHKAYCINWSCVCDNKWDCPGGDDEEYPEVCGKKSACVDMYKCGKTEQTCVHLVNVCDGKEDCPSRDDELFCELNMKCPLHIGCQCLLFALFCQNTPSLLFHLPLPYISVVISGSNICSVRAILRIFRNAEVLRLTNNSITEVCHLQFPPNLLIFSVGFKLFAVPEQQLLWFSWLEDFRCE